MSCVDRSILRLTSFEILFMGDIPPKVSIDEAVEMGKKFGGKNSAKFINGVLDNIYHMYNSAQSARDSKCILDDDE